MSNKLCSFFDFISYRDNITQTDVNNYRQFIIKQNYTLTQINNLYKINYTDNIKFLNIIFDVYFNKNATNYYLVKNHNIQVSKLENLKLYEMGYSSVTYTILTKAVLKAYDIENHIKHIKLSLIYNLQKIFAFVKNKNNNILLIKPKDLLDSYLNINKKYINETPLSNFFYYTNKHKYYMNEIIGELHNIYNDILTLDYRIQLNIYIHNNYIDNLSDNIFDDDMDEEDYEIREINNNMYTNHIISTHQYTNKKIYTQKNVSTDEINKSINNAIKKTVSFINRDEKIACECILTNINKYGELFITHLKKEIPGVDLSNFIPIFNIPDVVEYHKQKSDENYKINIENFINKINFMIDNKYSDKDLNVYINNEYYNKYDKFIDILKNRIPRYNFNKMCLYPVLSDWEMNNLNKGEIKKTYKIDKPLSKDALDCLDLGEDWKKHICHHKNTWVWEKKEQTWNNDQNSLCWRTFTKYYCFNENAWCTTYICESSNNKQISQINIDIDNISSPVGIADARFSVQTCPSFSPTPITQLYNNVYEKDEEKQKSGLPEYADVFAIEYWKPNPWNTLQGSDVTITEYQCTDNINMDNRSELINMTDTLNYNIKNIQENKETDEKKWLIKRCDKKYSGDLMGAIPNNENRIGIETPLFRAPLVKSDTSTDLFLLNPTTDSGSTYDIRYIKNTFISGQIIPKYMVFTHKQKKIKNDNVNSQLLKLKISKILVSDNDNDKKQIKSNGISEKHLRGLLKDDQVDNTKYKNLLSDIGLKINYNNNDKWYFPDRGNEILSLNPTSSKKISGEPDTSILDYNNDTYFFEKIGIDLNKTNDISYISSYVTMLNGLKELKLNLYGYCHNFTNSINDNMFNFILNPVHLFTYIHIINHMIESRKKMLCFIDIWDFNDNNNKKAIINTWVQHIFKLVQYSDKLNYIYHCLSKTPWELSKTMIDGFIEYNKNNGVLKSFNKLSNGSLGTGSGGQCFSHSRMSRTEIGNFVYTRMELGAPNQKEIAFINNPKFIKKNKIKNTNYKKVEADQRKLDLTQINKILVKYYNKIYTYTVQYTDNTVEYEVEHERIQSYCSKRRKISECNKYIENDTVKVLFDTGECKVGKIMNINSTESLNLPRWHKIYIIRQIANEMVELNPNHELSIYASRNMDNDALVKLNEYTNYLKTCDSIWNNQMEYLKNKNNGINNNNITVNKIHCNSLYNNVVHNEYLDYKNKLIKKYDESYDLKSLINYVDNIDNRKQRNCEYNKSIKGLKRIITHTVNKNGSEIIQIKYIPIK